MNSDLTATHRVPAPVHVPIQQGAAAPATWDRKAFRLAVRGLFRLFFRVRVIGLENLPATPCIICPNHLGWADPILIMLFFPPEPRIYIVGIDGIYKASRFGKRVLDWLQIMVAVDPHQPHCAARTMEDVVRRGGRLLIFPEGNLGAAEGQIQALHPGAAHAALHNHVPLVPVGLTGTHELWLRRPLTLRIGPPIAPEVGPGTMHSRVAALTDQVAAGIQALLPGDPIHPRWKPLAGWMTHFDMVVGTPPDETAAA
jgi:1-acyl-sn-glycerol-3-phosphate acyltransferase